MTSNTPDSDFLDRIRQRLGDRYEIAREITGGGMSRVFVAREIALDRTVVIKFLPHDIAIEANRDRFRREIQMAARLSHPHIAPLFTAAEDGELLYYTMPFIAGESLKHQIESGRHFSVDETLEILRDVASALAYAHKSGIVHRDIKPANVLREGDHALITDFGVAKAVRFALGLDSRSSSAATTTGMAIGTPAYMAPEQLAGDASADHRVDIYAFGLLGYELLTGKAPFRAPSPQAQLAAQLTQPPPPIQTVRNDVPPVLASLIARCLEKDAERRPPSAEAVMEVLRAVGATSGSSQQVISQNRRRSGVFLGVVSAVVLAVSIWAVLAGRKTPVPSAAVRADTPVAVAPVATVPSPAATAAATQAQRDSIRLLSEENARREARLMALLRDSVENAVRRSVSDSLTKANAIALAEERAKDSVARVSLRFNNLGLPTFSMGGRGVNITPEMIADRARHMGPPRRVGVAIYSGIRNPAMASAAAVVRDSIVARLHARGRFVVVPPDSVAGLLARSRSIDSLRTWTNAEMWVTVNVQQLPGDSLAWAVTARDFSAQGSYAQRVSVGKRVSVSEAADPAVILPLMESLTREIEMMDRAPRKEPPTGRP